MRSAVETELDRLVMEGRISGHTVEEDAGYIWASEPTLTYRMYVDGAPSRYNLGDFLASLSTPGARLEVTGLEGTVSADTGVRRSRQVCVTARFAASSQLETALKLIEERFSALAPGCTPGSWFYPDVRITGVSEQLRGTARAFAHCWLGESTTMVVLTLSPTPPLAGGTTSPVHVLESWIGVLDPASAHPSTRPSSGHRNLAPGPAMASEGYMVRYLSSKSGSLRVR